MEEKRESFLMCFPYVPAYAFWTIAKTTPVQVRLAPVHCLYNMLSSILDIVSSLGELPDVQYSCPAYFLLIDPGLRGERGI